MLVAFLANLLVVKLEDVLSDEWQTAFNNESEKNLKIVDAGRIKKYLSNTTSDTSKRMRAYMKGVK